VTGIYDFTLAADPVYPDTSVEAREFVTDLKEAGKPEGAPADTKYREQVSEMRQAASRVISF
jgi:polyhydroxyalkanoate synthesis regulator phasin